MNQRIEIGKSDRELSLSEGDLKIRILLLLEWRDYFSISTIAHTRAANFYKNLSASLNTIVTFLTIFVAVFGASTYLSTPTVSGFFNKETLDIMFSIAGGLAAILLAFVLQMDYRGKSELHRQCSKESHNLKRKIGRYLCFEDIPNHIVHSLNREAHYIENHYPITSKRIWESARTSYNNPERMKKKRYEYELIKYLKEKYKFDYELP